MPSQNETKTLSAGELLEIYLPVKATIAGRLEEFRQIWKSASDEELFRELVFCLLTPQSKARTCWRAVQRLERRDIIASAQACQLQEELVGVRFNRRKAEYICLARAMFRRQPLRAALAGFATPFAAREWLVENVLGLGYKEASHFLRNVGLGEEMAILDRHVLRNLLLLGVIDEVPGSLSRKTYLEIEKKMAAFSKAAGIPMGHLDLLLWYKEAGEVFK